MNAPVEDSGSASATFSLVGAPSPSAIYGDVTFVTDRGEVHGTFVEFVVEGTSHNVGAFMLLGGTGDYAGVYGFGKTIETVSFGEDGNCAGSSGSWIGEGFAG